MVQAEAERAREVKKEEARAGRKEARRILSMQIAKYAKSGVVTGAGTPLLVSNESKKQFERQNVIINEQGVWEYELGMSQAANILYAGKGESMLKMGASAYRAGVWGAATTLATGFGTMYLLSGANFGTPKTQTYTGTGKGLNNWRMSNYPRSTYA
jgi:hypothetical protein